MKKRFLGMLAVATVCCIALAACGSAQDDVSNFIGEWQMIATDNVADPVSEEEVQRMKERGLTVDLTLSADGTCDFNMFGEPEEGTWSAQSATEGTLLLEGQEVELTIDPDTGRLYFSQDGESLVFARV